MNHGFVRVASAVPSLRVADCFYNVKQIAQMMEEARQRNVAVVCFPELSVTGYTCQDLFLQQRLLDDAEQALARLLEDTCKNGVIGIVGMPVRYLGVLLNCAVVFQLGRILGVVAKTFLPNYKEFYEMRWFTSSSAVPEGAFHLAGQEAQMLHGKVFRTPDFTFGVEL